MALTELLTLLHTQVQAVLASPREIVAYLVGGLAASFVIGSDFVRTMIPLRWLAVAGNVGFVVFGLLHPHWLTLLVSAVLLPINERRALQLRPYIKPRKLKAGTVLFRKGDLGDHLLYRALRRGGHGAGHRSEDIRRFEQRLARASRAPPHPP